MTILRCIGLTENNDMQYHLKYCLKKQCFMSLCGGKSGPAPNTLIIVYWLTMEYVSHHFIRLRSQTTGGQQNKILGGPLSRNHRPAWDSHLMRCLKRKPFLMSFSILFFIILNVRTFQWNCFIGICQTPVLFD